MGRRRIAYLGAALALITIGVAITACSDRLVNALYNKVSLENDYLLQPGELTIETGPVTATLTWTRATEEWLPVTELEYKVFYSESANIDGVEDAEANGVVVADWTADLTTAEVTGLAIDTTYYFNVLVRNRARSNHYGMKGEVTDTDPGAPAPTGDLVISDQSTSGFTVSWPDAEDDLTPASDLQYLVVYSTNLADVATLASAETDATPVGSWTSGVNSQAIGGLLDNVTYYVNVIISDQVDQRAVHTAVGATTVKYPRIYWTDSTTLAVQRADLNGSNQENVTTTGLVTPFAIAVDPIARRVYWTDSGTTPPKIRSADFDGSNPRDEIDTGLFQPFGIAVDYVNSHLYWTDASNDVIYRSPLPPPTTNAATYELLTNASHSVDVPRGIAVDMTNGYFYWSEIGTARRIRKAATDLSSVTTLVNFLSSEQITDVAVLPGATDSQTVVYFLDRLNDIVHSSNMSGTVSDLIDTGLATPIGISLDVENEYLFWVDQTAPGVYGYDLNQASPTTDAADYLLSISGVQAPRGIDNY